MDSRHTSALPQAAWRPSLLPQPGAAPRRGQAEPVRLLAALRQDACVHAGAAAVSGLQSCLASLAALAFAGLGAAMLLHWSPPDGALAAHASRGAVAEPLAQQATVVEMPAMARPGGLRPAPAAARIERLAPLAQVQAPAAVQTPVSGTLAPAGNKPASGARTVSAKAPPPLPAARHATAARHRDGTAAAVKAPSGLAPLPAPATRAPQDDGDGAAPPSADSDAALLQAVLEWHEQRAPLPAPRR